jgi:hypothetical protein
MSNLARPIARCAIRACCQRASIAQRTVAQCQRYQKGMRTYVSETKPINATVNAERPMHLETHSFESDVSRKLKELTLPGGKPGDSMSQVASKWFARIHDQAC